MNSGLNIACWGGKTALANDFSISIGKEHNTYAFDSPTELKNLLEKNDLDLLIIPDSEKFNLSEYEFNYEPFQPKVALVGGHLKKFIAGIPTLKTKVFLIRTQFCFDSLAENRSLKQLHEDAKRFAPRVIHEIKNPALIIAQALETVRAQAVNLNDPIAIEAVHRAIYGMNRLNETMNTMMLLDATSLVVKRPRIPVEEIITMIKSTADDLVDQFHDCPKISLQCEDNIEKLFVEFEPTQFRQIMFNLLKNAYQAQTQKSNLSLRVSLKMAENSYMTISVIDNGPGIPETLRGKIFRTDFTNKNSPDSKGIGLALCRKIAHKNKAELMLDSDSEETKFDLLIPFAAA